MTDWEGCGPSCCRCHCECEAAEAERVAESARLAAITPEQWKDIARRAHEQYMALGWDRLDQEL